MKKFLWIGLAFLVVLVGCNLVTREYYLGVDELPENGKGMLVLMLDGSDVPTKTIAPVGLSMDIWSYDINGYIDYGEAGETIQFEEQVLVGDLTDGTVYTKNSLTPDSNWTIEVIARNADDLDGDDNPDTPNGTEIGYGILSTVAVLANVITPIDIPVSPKSGNGSLTLAIEWHDDTIDTPVITAFLAEAGGSPAAFNFDIINEDSDPSYASHTTSSHLAGYYTLTVILTGVDPISSATTQVWGDAVSIRIIEGATTDYTWGPIGDGTAQVTLDPDLNNPITIELVDNLSDTPATVTANLLDAPDGSYFTYAWYEDGILKRAPASTPVLNYISDVSHEVNMSAFAAGSSHNVSVIVTEYLDDTMTLPIATISSSTLAFTAPIP